MKSLTRSIIGFTLAIMAFSTVYTTVYAAVGIPDYLTPKNVGMKDINQKVAEQVKNAPDEQAAAVSAVNIIIQYVSNLLLFFAAPLAVLFIARAGSDYIFAMGDEAVVEKAKRELTWALLGLLLVMFSYLIVRLMIQPFIFYQEANDKILGKGTSTTAETKTTDSTGDMKGFDLEQVKKNAKTDPGAKAYMYDPSDKLYKNKGTIIYDKNIDDYIYKIGGKDVTEADFQAALKQQAATNAAKK